jgi:dephospho-CoA kinase
MPIEEKRRMADEVIDCSGSLEHTREQVIALVDKLKRMEAEQRKQPREADQNDRRKK